MSENKKQRPIDIIDGERPHGEELRAVLNRNGFTHLRVYQDWMWLFFGYNGNPIVKIAYDNQKRVIAGHYGMLPMEFVFNGEVFSGGKIEGSLTHEDYRGRKIAQLYPELTNFRLFKELVAAAVQEIHSRKLDLVFGFPNDAASNTQYTTGFQAAPFDFTQFILSYNTRPVLDSKLPSLHPIVRFLLSSVLDLQKHFRRLSKNDPNIIFEEYDPKKYDLATFFMEFAKRKKVISIHRSKRYLEWRYLENRVYQNRIVCAQNKSGQLLGYIIFGHGRVEGCHEGRIEDFAYIEEMGIEDLPTQLISYAVRALEESRVDVIFGANLSNSKFSEINKAYLKIRFFPKRRLMNNFFFVSENLRRKGADIYNTSNWYINYSFNQY
jgi:hypothetical protein